MFELIRKLLRLSEVFELGVKTTNFKKNTNPVEIVLRLRVGKLTATANGEDPNTVKKNKNNRYRDNGSTKLTQKQNRNQQRKK